MNLLKHILDMLEGKEITIKLQQQVAEIVETYRSSFEDDEYTTERALEDLIITGLMNKHVKKRIKKHTKKLRKEFKKSEGERGSTLTNILQTIGDRVKQGVDESPQLPIGIVGVKVGMPTDGVSKPVIEIAGAEHMPPELVKMITKAVEEIAEDRMSELDPMTSTDKKPS